MDIPPTTWKFSSAERRSIRRLRSKESSSATKILVIICGAPLLAGTTASCTLSIFGSELFSKYTYQDAQIQLSIEIYVLLITDGPLTALLLSRGRHHGVFQGSRS